MGYINITSSQYSKGLKEKVATSLCGFYKNKKLLHNDGYIDTNSTELCEFLKKEYKWYGWRKNHSQNPFDVYSIRGRLAIELKTSNIMNATIYSDKAKIKDVLSKKDLVKIDPSLHNEFMDVLLVFVKKDKVDKTHHFLEGFKIVDGKVLGIDYEDYKGAKNLFSQMNDHETKREILELIYKKTNNCFVGKILDGSFDDICNLDFRKLLSVNDSFYFKGVV